MPRITPFKIALACGTAGAYVDVTAYASWAPGEGVAGSWGKQDQFRDTTPGALSFYLDNYDGRFTPDTTNGLLATPLTEGMGVSWQLGTRIIAGSILGFQMIEDNWGRIRVDVDDSLGDLGRNTVSGTLLARSMVLGSNPYLYWPFNDTGNTFSEQSGNQQQSLIADPLTQTYVPSGQPGIPFLNETQIFITPGGGVSSGISTLPIAPGTFSTINYASGSMGVWGMWFTGVNAGGLDVIIRPNGYTSASSHAFKFGQTGAANFYMTMGAGAAVPIPFDYTVPHYLQLVVTYSGSSSITGEFFIDGVSQYTRTYTPGGTDPAGLSSNYLRTPAYVGVTPSGGGGAYVSHLSHTPTAVPEYLLALGTESGLIRAVGAASAGVSVSTPPVDLSTAPTQPQPTNASALAKLNDVIRSEQGYLDCVTTGTLLAPVQAVRVRARQRPATVSYSFDAQTELSGQPDLIRDLTNLVASATAQGPTTSTTWLDATVAPRAGSSNTTDQIVSTQYVDQLGYAQDRILRGKNTAIHSLSFTVDALTTPTDRSADLLAIAFGDRIQITNFPSTVTGFTTFDCWIIGRTEAHDRDQHKFTFYIQPVLPATAIYDTNLYMSGGLHTLNATINSSVTSLGCLSSDLLTYFSQTETPYTILIDSEQITVTACGAPSAGVQTMTVTRAANGTVAAAHTSGAAVEIATASLYAF